MSPKIALASLDSLIRSVEKSFGRGILMAADGDAVDNDIEVVATGSLALDLALGAGGVPKGRIIEIYGPEASGKTTLALSMIAQAQKLGRCSGAATRASIIRSCRGCSWACRATWAFRVGQGT